MSSSDEVGIGCVVILILLALSMAIGGFCVDYVLWTCFGKDLPTWADCCIALVTSGVAVPAAIVCLIVKACDVETPFFGQPVVV